jgi:hypothetical protein
VKNYISVAALVAFFILDGDNANSSWLSANKIYSSSHSQNTTVPDCFYSQFLKTL